MALLLATACAHGERAPEPSGALVGAGTAPARLAQYVVADPRTNAGITVPLGAPGALGVVVDRRRIVVGRGAPRVAEEVPADGLLGVVAVPARLGGGFAFWTQSALYHAATFDGHLVPVAHFPADIDSMSRPPGGLIVHTRNGERWGITPKGDRIPIRPLGAADVEGLDDGRALAWTDAGTVSTSTDGGEHWADVTAQMRGLVDRILQREGELWAMSGTRGGRVEHDGRLSWFEHVPLDEPSVRPADPRWRSDDPPVRAALHGGALVDEATAVVLSAGDIVRVDLQTGAIRSLTPASLPPDAQCESVAAPDDMLFACSGHGQASTFVVAHVLSGAPTIERTFGSTRFTSSDDGGLLVEGPCSGPVTAPSTPLGTASAETTVCVRQPGGGWEPRDLAGLAPDGGATQLQVARWVPRADGRAVAILLRPDLGMYDASTGSFTALPEEMREVVATSPALPLGLMMARPSHLPRPAGVDGSWSFTSDGSLRGWQRTGETVQIGLDGHVGHSPYAFEALSMAGPFALGVQNGRLYQSSDHGGAWTEVELPPGGIEASELGACSFAGCDLGAFYRIGWSPRAPREEPAKRPVGDVPDVRRSRAPALACRSAGAAVSQILPRKSSPEDLGLGMQRLPTTSSDAIGYVHETLARGIVNPVHEPAGDASDASPSLRALFSGYDVDGNPSGARVSGPNPSLLSLRRGISYAPPFDPAGRIVRTTLAVADIVAAARRAGASTDELLSEDPTRAANAITLLPSDPLAPSDLALHNPEVSVLTILRGVRTRPVIHRAPSAEVVVSGVLLPNDEAAFLEVAAGGTSRVFKVSASGVAGDLFEASAVASDASSPANTDALALGPKSELAVLRTPSGSDPASAYDPAILLVPGRPPQALAPWSTLAFEGDPVCRAEVGGFRAVVQLVAPWIQLGSPELQTEDAPMLARVRWTPDRVCLEAFEVRAAPVTLRIDGEDTRIETWLVGRGGSFARLATAEGIEWRQPLDCTITR